MQELVSITCSFPSATVPLRIENTYHGNKGSCVKSVWV